MGPGPGWARPTSRRAHPARRHPPHRRGWAARPGRMGSPPGRHLAFRVGRRLGRMAGRFVPAGHPRRRRRRFRRIGSRRIWPADRRPGRSHPWHRWCPWCRRVRCRLGRRCHPVRLDSSRPRGLRDGRGRPVPPGLPVPPAPLVHHLRRPGLEACPSRQGSRDRRVVPARWRVRRDRSTSRRPANRRVPRAPRPSRRLAMRCHQQDRRQLDRRPLAAPPTAALPEQTTMISPTG